MAKKIMQDMIVRKRKRQIIAEEKKAPEIRPEPQKQSYLKRDTISETAANRRSFISKFKLSYKFAIALFFIFAFIFILKSFSWVTLAVTPKQEFINLDTSLEAFIGTAQGASRSQGGQNIYFELMEISEEREKSVESTGIKELERKASGQIIIYNAYSSAPQTLVRRTRFSSSDGKIYRIDNQIIVPGAKIIDGNIVPSSIEAVVYADIPGEEYNIGLSDFTIPGFKGDARYEKFYARSKTEISGGFIGKLRVISDDDITSVKNTLRDEIKDSLIKKAKMSIPNGFLYYDDLVMLDFKLKDDNFKAGDEAENFSFKEIGSLKVFLPRETDLSNALISKYIESGAPLRVSNLKDMSVSLSERDKDNERIVFNIKGIGHFVWNIDEENLKKDFLIKNGNNIQSFLKNYPIETADIIFHPSWWKFVPKYDSKVKYEEILKSEL
ncbi:MAG: hypothetical protein NUV64_01165 [Parcubacteria group bacterium]|nr:hypothetical protein [Parcubacteria group bacterium]MCR4342971.1 hypothetical protein [Patescibacteria group bacterium]